AGNRLGPPEGGFDVDVLRVVGHGGGIATHDAGQRLQCLVVGDHTDFAVHGDSVAVEQLELFSRLSPAHVQRALNLGQVEDGARAAVFEHHVVGDVHQRAHTALAATGQAVHHPLGRGGFGVHVAHDAAREAAAKVGGADLHGLLVRNLGGHGRNR